MFFGVHIKDIQVYCYSLQIRCKFVRGYFPLPLPHSICFPYGFTNSGSLISVTSPIIVKLEILVVTFSVDQLGKMERRNLHMNWRADIPSLKQFRMITDLDDVKRQT